MSFCILFTHRRFGRIIIEVKLNRILLNAFNVTLSKVQKRNLGISTLMKQIGFSLTRLFNYQSVVSNLSATFADR